MRLRRKEEPVLGSDSCKPPLPGTSYLGGPGPYGAGGAVPVPVPSPMSGGPVGVRREALVSA